MEVCTNYCVVFFWYNRSDCFDGFMVYFGSYRQLLDAGQEIDVRSKARGSRCKTNRH